MGKLNRAYAAKHKRGVAVGITVSEVLNEFVLSTGLVHQVLLSLFPTGYSCWDCGD